MSPSESTELRRELRLKLMLKRGTALASVYSRPEVQQPTLRSYDELVARAPRLAAAVMDVLHPSCAVLDRFVASQQRVLDRFVEVAQQRGVIGMSTDTELRDAVTREVFPTADEYRRHVFGLLEGRLEVADRIVHALESADSHWRNSAERMGDLVEGETVALREVLRCDTEHQLKRLYST